MNTGSALAKVARFTAAFAIAGLILPTAASAAGTITNVTLSTSNATPGQTVSVGVEVTTSGSQCNNNWRRTSITVNGVESIFDYPFNTQFTSGSYTQSHDITAPASGGTYDVFVNVFTGPEDALPNCAYNLLDSEVIGLSVQNAQSGGSVSVNYDNVIFEESGSTDASPFEGVMFCMGVPCPVVEETTEEVATEETGGTTEDGEIAEATEEVLAVETVDGGSCFALASYIGFGNDNADDVKKVQEFLNAEMGSSLEVNGTFDDATREVVKAFQLKYAEEILAPWASHGLATDEPTGIIYKTTQRMINMLSCPGTEIPMPELP